ncbi:bifunctional metallophosphatase/5'-nucleotidase [Serratia microhaemolytica]|uniref:bifunctional metallophosphatase/5'-nucleotidase n=1 Tax=Serratia microhaemolytica TaxID=2675110 RepID=UPI0013923C32|nr:5'-nucleotidase C-terminal domain-containing protein [Serratia microhaemolytica]
MNCFLTIISKFFALIAIMLLPLHAVAAPFSDIANSADQQAIISLYKRNIIIEDSAKYRPQVALTRAEAAVLVARAFQLAEIKPFDYKKDPALIKQYAYPSHLGVVNESFMVAEAQDTLHSSAREAIEAILSAKLMTLTDHHFHPDATISSAEFSTMLAKAIYGVNSTDHSVTRAIADGLLDKKLATSTRPILRGEAASALARIVDNPEFKIITLFATSDIHGHLQPYKPSGSKVHVGSLARMSYLIEKMRQRQPNLLLLDGGDAPYNTNIANAFAGRSTIEVMNAMGYDATVLGNHDFDFAFDVLRANARLANHPFLSVNTYWRDGRYPKEFQKSIVKQIDGINVAIIGATDAGSAMSTHYKNTEQILFKDHFDTTRAEVARVKAGKNPADLIILLSHLHEDNPVVLDKVSGIDIAIGGGNDLMGQPLVKQDSWLINPGKHAETLNQINVNLLHKKKIGVVFSQIVINPDMPVNQTVVNIVQKYARELDKKMSEVVGKAQVNLNAERIVVRRQESNLANAVADASRDYFNADIALQNGGGVRASINKGDITIGAIFEALPFDNRLVLIETSGGAIKQALENGVKLYPEASGAFLQVSGLSYTFDAEQPTGQRISRIMVGDRALDLNKRYKVVINDFLAGGGDGFDMLKCLGSDQQNYSRDTRLLIETNDFLRDIFKDYVRQKGNLKPQNEQRIVILHEKQAI